MTVGGRRNSSSATLTVSPSMNPCRSTLAHLRVPGRGAMAPRLRCLICLLCGAPLAAQRPTAPAVKVTGTVVLAGRLDDGAWPPAPAATLFTQQRPNDGEHATERTEVRFLYDGDAIYVGARMYDSRGRAGV